MPRGTGNIIINCNNNLAVIGKLLPSRDQTLEVEVIPPPQPHFTDDKPKLQEVEEL